MEMSSSEEYDGQDGDVPNRNPQERLLEALLNNDFANFEQLLNSGTVHANYRYLRGHHYSTLLEIACRRKNRGIFTKALLGKVKPNINHLIPEPIHHAAKRGIYDAMQALLNHKLTDVNAVDSKGNTALHYLVSYTKTEDDHESYEKCIRLLLSKSNLDINKPNNKGFTPIHQAAYHKHKHIVKLILERCKEDLDIDSSFGNGKTAREFINEVYPELNQLLPPLKYSKLPGPQSQLLVALQNQHIDIFCGLLRQVDLDGNTLLDPNYWYGKPFNITCLEMSCMLKERGEFVEALLEAGADPNAVNLNSEKAPIHVAAQMCNNTALEILLGDDRTNVNAIDKNKRTALHYALDQNDEDTFQRALECLSILLNKDNININMEDIDNYTPIVLAVLNHNEKAVEYILKVKKDQLDLVKPQGKENKSGEECIRDTFPKMKFLLPEVVKYTEPDVQSTLLELLYKRHVEKFIKELKHAVNTNLVTCSNINNNFLQLAISYDLQNVVQELLALGTDPNGFDRSNQFPPLVLAAMNQNHNILRQLLACQDVIVDITDIKGNTALHHAVWKEDVESCIELINYGASITKKNVLGRVPLAASVLGTLLDKCLKTNNKYPKEENYEVIFDYRLVTAHKKVRTPSTPCNKKVSVSRSEGSISDYGIELQTLFNNDICTVNVNNTAEQEVKKELIKNEQSEIEEGHSIFTAEMDLLHYISQNKNYKHLLHHPIVGSFLKFKWECVKKIFYINLLFYVAFVLILNVHIWLNQEWNVRNTTTNSTQLLYYNLSNEATFTSQYIIFIALILLLVLLGLRECIQCLMCPSRYFRNAENILDVSLVILTIIILLPSENTIDYIRPTVTVAVILLSCMELILLTGRFPQLSLNIEMLKAVSKNYCWFLLSYAFLIIAFAHCFYTMFKHASESKISSGYNYFESFPFTVFKTIIMMTGEFDAGNSMAFDVMPVTSTVVFVLFVFFIAIVLLNLLIGLTVNDTRAIQNKSKILCIASRIHVIYEIESVVIECHKHYKRLFCKIKCCDNLFQKLSLFPTSTHDRLVRTLPNSNGVIKNQFKEKFLRGCKIDNNILEEAVKIISNRGKQYENPVENTNQKVEKLEETVKEMMCILKTITSQLDLIVTKGQEDDNDKENLTDSTA